MYGRETMVMRVADDAMAPWFRRNDYVYVDPDESASPGQYVAVAGEDPGAVSVGVVDDECGAWRVRMLDETRPDIVFGTEAETAILGVVVFSGRRV